MDTPINNNEQTAFPIAGFPAGEQGAAVTDGADDVVEALTNKLEEAFTSEVDTETIKNNK